MSVACEFVLFRYSLTEHSIAVCVLINSLTHLQLPTLPPPTPLYIAICDITVAMEQVDIIISKNQALQI